MNSIKILRICCEKISEFLMSLMKEKMSFKELEDSLNRLIFKNSLRSKSFYIFSIKRLSWFINLINNCIMAFL